VDGGREVLGGDEGWRERTAQAERDEGIFFLARLKPGLTKSAGTETL